MKCMMYMPYYGYGEDNSNLENFYSDSNSYVEALRKYAMQDSPEMAYEHKKEDVKYTNSECNLYDSDNQPMTIDEIVGYYGKDEMIMMIAEFNLAAMNEDFESELNSWANDHERLDKETNIDQDERMLVEPKRDLKIVFKNLKGNDTYCTLSNAMILEKVDNEHYVLIVNKVIFTKNF